MFLKKKKPAAPSLQTQPLPPEIPAPPDLGAPAGEQNGLTLAYLGDAVYELMARSYILTRYGGKVHAMHEKTVSFSNAAFQSFAAKTLLPLLDEAETAAYRRGRNAHPGHVPKHKTQSDYHSATGLEALFGWLYAQKHYERLQTLFGVIANCNEEFENEKRSKTEEKR